MDRATGRTKNPAINDMLSESNCCGANDKMKIATGELDWDLAAMKATENSWKDEWITLLFSIPLILAFCGDWGNQIVQAGFAALSDMPGWYQYSLGGIVSASIGMRGVSKYFGGKK